jgi:hypothetical protein
MTYWDICKYNLILSIFHHMIICVKISDEGDAFSVTAYMKNKCDNKSSCSFTVNDTSVGVSCGGKCSGLDYIYKCLSKSLVLRIFFFIINQLDRESHLFFIYAVTLNASPSSDIFTHISSSTVSHVALRTSMYPPGQVQFSVVFAHAVSLSMKEKQLKKINAKWTKCISIY